MAGGSDFIFLNPFNSLFLLLQTLFFSMNMKIIDVKRQFLVNTLNANANNRLCGLLIFVKSIIYSEGSKTYPMDQSFSSQVFVLHVSGMHIQ